MNFILSNHFGNAVDSLHAIFKPKDNSQTALLADELVSRAKRMIAPFVLRRLKEQVSAFPTPDPDAC
jgi:SWI/SNF-related matrix-associated actin-dependent regulator of chromatin subfamily A containing DEAD/H box 1